MTKFGTLLQDGTLPFGILTPREQQQQQNQFLFVEQKVVTSQKKF